MNSPKEVLEQIVRVADNEAYDEQAREQMRSLALVALELIEKNSPRAVVVT